MPPAHRLRRMRIESSTVRARRRSSWPLRPQAARRTMKDATITSTVTLDRVRVHRSEVVEAMIPYYRRFPAERRPDRDAYEIRSMIDGWGRTVRAELRCP